MFSEIDLRENNMYTRSLSQVGIFRVLIRCSKTSLSIPEYFQKLRAQEKQDKETAKIVAAIRRQEKLLANVPIPPGSLAAQLEKTLKEMREREKISPYM